ncbi:MAG: hypothetical protein V1753_12615 [Pseudomonadota bacterium]
MANELSVQYIDTNKDLHFTGEIIQNAKENEAIPIPDFHRVYNELLIIGIAIQSLQPLEWDVFFWKSGGYDSTNLNTDSFIEHVLMPITAEKQINGANQYYSALTGLKIPYRCEDIKTIYASLCNRSAVAKLAGATGEIKITFMVRPVLG